nr:MAG TPA: hypothetical protein [Caudoviricetes sp.]DAN72065.1 MAG TPA: hypothetical protein [Caudoviricetes sp.]DAX53791.1 MAG TPA: hypothetical protein [Caudoviricetes sp.]
MAVRHSLEWETLLKNVFQMLETLTLEVLMQVNCQLVKLALEILR